ncbi:uncharacterized protein BP5553_00308 [Venustampulla echinocandica]|uniref:Required for respiratory growth protein 9, mitochondrial n=1 Tax=Venustampulla echinocandica TaxID=2656787 RepID=A0A370TXT1_9HELO|nr:uncharacterized protein BP5553_00308 [Venustampulla echinocandica]RDL40329.1 hypothetical protein BP5553_00308 [Venustampulla echinocandica]
MTCRCTASSLRLFIRSVTHVDFPGPTPSAFGSSKQDIRGFASHSPFPARRFPIRSHSTRSPAASPANNQSEPESKSDLSYWPQESDAVESETGDGASAFVELSPDAIDAILAESAEPAESSHFDTQLRGPTRNQKAERDVELEEQLSNTGFVRAKLEDTGFPFQRSSPRASTEPWTSSRNGPRNSRSDVDHRGKKAAEDDWKPPKKEQWQIQKAALKEKFPDGWAPSKRLSPDAITGIRALHAQMPEKFTTRALGDHFKVSPEAIRRILKSKWQPNAEEVVDRETRWFRRGEKVWSRYAELGAKPPRKWRDVGIGRGKPEWKKKTGVNKQEGRIIPSWITTAEPGGANVSYQAKANNDAHRSSANEDARGSSEFKFPELITTAAPPDRD